MPPRLQHASRRLFLLRASAVALPLGLPLAAHAGFNFFLSEYTASREELQAEITKRFPLTQRYAEVFNVSLLDPVLALDAGANRAALTARLSINSPFLQPSTVGGMVSISSALRYDAPALALRLQDPRAERLELDGVTGRDAERLKRIGGAVAQELLQGYPLRTFKPEELRFGRKTYEIGDITVAQDEIKVQLK
ncbi:DUF1439 domain-containing protein [Variovorax sp. OV329]|uniref:DUF1439 domain-containing protein n=1 Tax=Variovorax sp. OV329 TaxID=1882825 RepID=UPI0008E45EAA|nr:DUF1439 domain-containing protein [Variovorax sp. OV329]SFM55969.1 Protein of unknown function [Variovorax sp. OV329]